MDSLWGTSWKVLRYMAREGISEETKSKQMKNVSQLLEIFIFFEKYGFYLSHILFF